MSKKIHEDWVEYNRLMKRVGSSTKTFEEYVKYRSGKFKPKLRGTPLPKYSVSDHKSQYPSGEQIGVAFSKQPLQYTGTLIKGIATMHKSNAVPVLNEQDAVDISRMRRG